MANTAKCVIDNLTGHPGPARCYKLDPPARLIGKDADYVVVWIAPQYAHQNAEAGILPSTELGGSTINSVRRQGGSVTLHTDYDPDNKAYVDGIHQLVLGMLGGYEVTT